jgi:hypothetical protein
MLLRRYRRLFAPLTALFLLAPLLVGLAEPDTATTSADEARTLAAAPALPRGWRDLPAALRQTDAYLRDHFGMRRLLIHANALIVRLLLRSGNDTVLMGRNDWFFLLGGDTMLAQSAGLLVHAELVEPTADVIATMQRVLAARGVPLLVAAPPNSATIYPEEVPKWARYHGAPTEYDLLYAALSARGVSAVDLRPVLQTEKLHGQVFMKHDTHWSPRGAVAGFNAMVEAAGLPGWTYTSADALTPPITVTGGDLARLLGIGADVTEQFQWLRIPPSTARLVDNDPYLPNVVKRDAPGPTILVIGDSFTRWWFKDLIATRTGQVVWMHHQRCGFDWKWIDDLHPDQVWFMTTERLMLCAPGARPVGLDKAAAALTSAAR